MLVAWDAAGDMESHEPRAEKDLQEAPGEICGNLP
jgi:hypothetical protein